MSVLRSSSPLLQRRLTRFRYQHFRCMIPLERDKFTTLSLDNTQNRCIHDKENSKVGVKNARKKKIRRDPQIPAVALATPKMPLDYIPAWSWMHNGNTVTATNKGRLLPGVFNLNVDRDWILYDVHQNSASRIWAAKQKSWEALSGYKPDEDSNSYVMLATAAARHECNAFRAEDTDECRAAQQELLDMVIDHVLKRYPSIFAVKDYSEHECGYRQASVVQVKKNGVVIREYKVKDFAAAPLLLAGKLVQEDFVIIRDRTDPTIESGSVCFSFSGLPKRFGQKLDDVHAKVNGYGNDLSKPVNRLFAKSINVEKPLWRTNFGIAWTDELFTSPERYPFRLGIHKTNEEAKSAMLSLIQGTPGGIGEALFLKVEYQTFRRLERIPGDRVVFSIRTFIDPFSSMSPKAAAQLGKNIRCASEGEFKKYLGIDDEEIRFMILDYLDSRARGGLAADDALEDIAGA